MKIPKISKNDLLMFLWEMKFDGTEKFPYVKNYFSYLDGVYKNGNMFDYLLFLKYQLGNYRKYYRFGEIDFQTYLDREYPPIVDEQVSKLEDLENYIRTIFVMDDTLSVSGILEIIDKFK